MKTARYGLIALCLVVLSAIAVPAQISIGIGLPNVSIGINIPLYPDLVPVPGYPVYYAPQVSANYFFYDGMYWIFHSDNWYASSWYNGPWGLVNPAYVPVFILRIPVRYYVRPPAYFRGWRYDAPPPMGSALGPQLGAASPWMGSVEPRVCPGSRPAPRLPATVQGRPLSAI